MEKETRGTVIAAVRQWWLKVNTKSARLGPLDGATFPYILKIRYAVDGNEYTCRKWLNPGCTVPPVGSQVSVFYRVSKPSKARVEIYPDNAFRK